MCFVCEGFQAAFDGEMHSTDTQRRIMCLSRKHTKKQSNNGAITQIFQVESHCIDTQNRKIRRTPKLMTKNRG